MGWGVEWAIEVQLPVWGGKLMGVWNEFWWKEPVYIRWGLGSRYVYSALGGCYDWHALYILLKKVPTHIGLCILANNTKPGPPLRI